MEIVFSCKNLINLLNKNLNFPIGKKKNLTIEKEIAEEWEKIKYVIRGVFDTDGSLYFDKTPVGKPYPVLSIHMNAPILLKQIRKKLLEKGFKVQLRKDNTAIFLKGSIQLNKWFKEIKPMNDKHVSKYKKWIETVPVA